MSSLADALSKVLPLNSKWELSHIQTIPKESRNLVVNRRCKQNKPKTIKVEHFITIASQNIIILGLEIYVYVTLLKDYTEHHLFVSKADTTGLLDPSVLNVKAGQLVKAILNFLINIPIEKHYCQRVLVKPDPSATKPISFNGKSTIDCLKHIADQFKTNKHFQLKKSTSTNYMKLKPRGPIITKISLFTRPENQYLFPYSFKNKYKHVLSGDKLLRWWIDLINELMSELSLSHSKTSCKLVIPGADSKSILKFLPESPLWTTGSIFNSEGNNKAIFNIPLFPDDPKGRFLEHLVVENRIKKVNLNQFWVELSIRQEFRLGIIVGVIGVEMILESDKSKTIDVKVISKGKFKKIKNLIIGEDYSIEDNVLELYDSISRIDSNLFLQTIGKKTVATSSIKPYNNSPNNKSSKANNLSSAVKGKPSIEKSLNDVNDLSCMIRKKPKK